MNSANDVLVRENFRREATESLLQATDDAPRNPALRLSAMRVLYCVLYPVQVLLQFAVYMNVVGLSGRRAKCDYPLYIWISCYLSIISIRMIIYITIYSIERQLNIAETEAQASGNSPQLLYFRRVGTYVIHILDVTSMFLWCTATLWLYKSTACDKSLFNVALLFWSLQTSTIFLPCLVFLVLICCFPIIIRLLPLFVPASPNQLPTMAEHIDKLETITYENYCNTLENASTSCPICISEFIESDYLLRLPCASHHVFHKDCVVRWLKLSQLCPVCRANISQIITHDISSGNE